MMSGYDGNHHRSHIYDFIQQQHQLHQQHQQHQQQLVTRPSVICSGRSRESSDHIDTRMIPPDLELNIDWSPAAHPAVHPAVAESVKNISPSDHYQDNSATKRLKTESGFSTVYSEAQSLLQYNTVIPAAQDRNRKLSESSSSSTSTNVANSPKV